MQIIRVVGKSAGAASTSLLPEGGLAAMPQYWSYRSATIEGRLWRAVVSSVNGNSETVVLEPTRSTPTFSNAARLLTSPQFERGADLEPLDEDVLGAHLLVRGFDDNGIWHPGDDNPSSDSLEELVSGLMAEASRRDMALVLPYVANTDTVLAGILTEREFSAGTVTGACHMDTGTWASFEDFLAAMDRRRRARVRQEERQFAATFTNVAPLLASSAWEIAELEAQTHVKYGGSRDVGHIAFKRRLLFELFGSRTHLVGARIRDVLHAVSAQVDDGTDFYTFTFGAASDPPPSAAYPMLCIYHPLRQAFALGLRSVRAGFEGFEAKYLRGMTVSPRTCWLWHPDRNRRSQLTRRLHALDSVNHDYFRRYTHNREPLPVSAPDGEMRTLA